ncbi:hypothetical protein B7463_g12502, partial [Scytalidium lignicola]
MEPDMELGIQDREDEVVSAPGKDLEHQDTTRSPNTPTVPRISPAPLQSEGGNDTDDLHAFHQRYASPSLNATPLSLSQEVFLLETMYLNNVVYARAKLLKHPIILHNGRQEGDGKYQDPRAVKDYHYWRSSANQIPQLLDSSSACDPLAKKLAMLECAECHENSPSKELERFQQEVFRQCTLEPNTSKRTSLGVLVEEGLKKARKRSLFVSRLTMALFGGVALIAPMLIMTLHTTKLTVLLTTSLFVVAVAVILAWWMEDAQSKDIIAATAAYAAVLVVFVGTGTTLTG